MTPLKNENKIILMYQKNNNLSTLFPIINYYFQFIFSIIMKKYRWILNVNNLYDNEDLKACVFLFFIEAIKKYNPDKYNDFMFIKFLILYVKRQFILKIIKNQNNKAKKIVNMLSYNCKNVAQYKIDEILSYDYNLQYLKENYNASIINLFNNFLKNESHRLEKQRLLITEIFNYKYYKQYSVKKIAKALNLSVKKVSNIIYQTLINFRKKYKNVLK